jgi:hypothetical protein
VLVHEVVLALHLHEVHPGDAFIAGVKADRAANASVIFPSGAVDAIGNPNC